MKLEGKGIVKNMTLYNPKDYSPNYFLHMKGNIDSILEKKIKYHLNHLNEGSK